MVTKIKAGWTVEVKDPPEGSNGFVVVPKHWIVEQTFAWICKFRRNAKDYERNVESSKAMVHIAMIARMLNYLDKRDFLV